MKKIISFLVIVFSLFCFGQSFTFNDPVLLQKVVASGGSPPPTWIPSDTANTVKQWNRPEDISTDPVTSWPAVTGVTLTSVGSNNPDRLENNHNGQHVVRLNGVDNALRCTFGSTQNSSYTIGIIFKLVGDPSAFTIIFAGPGSGLDTVLRTLSSQFQFYSDNGTPGNILATDNNWHVMLLTVNSASGTYQIDGGSETTYNFGDAGMYGLTIGANTPLTGGWSQLDIQEIVVWNGVLDSGDKADWFTYGVTSR